MNQPERGSRERDSVERGSIERDSTRYEVARLNWAGLGVVSARGRERCVPLTRVGEQVQVNWHYGAWGKVTGERVDASPEVARGLDAALGCDQGRRCSGCSLRHLSAEERAHAQLESHLGALERLSERDLSAIEPVWLGAPPRDGYRARVTASVRHLNPTASADQPRRWGLALRARWGDPVDLSRCPNHPASLRALVAVCEAWLTAHSTTLRLDEVSREESRDAFRLGRVSVQAGAGLPPWVTLHLEEDRREGSLGKRERERRLAVGETWLASLPIEALGCALKTALESMSGDEVNASALKIFCEVSLRDQARSSHGLQLMFGVDAASTWRCERGQTFVARPPAWLPQSPLTLEALREAVSECLWGDSDLSSALSSADAEPQAHPHAPRAKPELVFELGCGVGLLSVALLRERPSLTWVGADVEPESARCAQESADLNGVGARASFHGVDGRRALAQLETRPDVMIIHAMRKPISGLLKLAAHLGVPRICYLAPSAPALARDLAEHHTEPHAYTLDALSFLDQMPGTAQLMTIARLTLRATPTSS